ncbi:VWA domain-containing protein [Marinomonas balearica]|uniref:von Willebrand factor type A domain-containing protein n=1 Tax=Marinomonas balearica TaxID=491947 RepID=A0A4R6M6G0_9GAMM|nr:VWA domain-containing protein [Marinomonas balearica]TDO96968.1 von Willebrand factor type A domain-containing protein [Marinomonas balearica]
MILRMQSLLYGALIVVCSVVFPKAFADTQFRIIVDASGSMVISDPDKLTSEALKLISNLAPEEHATLGVWLFGETPRVLLPEAPINKETKAKLANYVDNYVTQDLKTDLESILELLLKTPDGHFLSKDINRHWILVTDGMVDVDLDKDINEASRRRIMTTLTEALEKRGIHLHTVSMTGYTDEEMLKQLSVKTNASHTEVASPEELLDTFDRIFAQTTPAEEVPFEGNSFFIDPSIDEVTLLVFHEDSNTNPELIKPNGMNVPLRSSGSVTVSHTPYYTLVTILEPESGTWQVKNVDIQRSSIRVITSLNAQATKISPVVFVNEPVFSTVGLFESNDLIKDPKVLGLMDVTQELALITGDSRQIVEQRKMKQSASQFKHKVEKLSTEGNYALSSTVDGQTFTRKLTQYFSVFPAIKFDSANRSENFVAFSATPTNLRLNTLRSNVKLDITYKDGTTETQEMPFVGQGYWEKVFPIEPGSQMKVKGKLIGITQAGIRFEYESEPWTVERKAAGEVRLLRGDEALSTEALTALATTNRALMPVVVAPQVTVVADEDIETAPEAVVEESAEEKPDETPPAQETEDEPVTEIKEVATLGMGDWLLYGGLNLLGLSLIGGGYFAYRRIKRNKDDSEELEQEDV